MDSYELRSEIISSGTKFYIQSNLVSSRSAVVTSLFNEGKLLSKQDVSYDTTLSPDQLRHLVRDLHDEHKARITSLLDIREQLKKDIDARAHIKLAEALYKQRLFKEAMAEVIRAIKLGHEAAVGYSILGNCLLQVGDNDKALKAFLKGIDVAPEYPDLHNDLGVTMLRLKRCRDAVNSFEKALSLNKYYQAAVLNLGIALSYNVVLKQDYELSRGSSERVVDILKMCVQLRPSLDTEAFRSAITAAGQERFDVAYEQLVAIRDEIEREVQPDLSLDIYLALRFRGEAMSGEEIDRFIDRVNRALDTNPEYADLQNDLGILYTAKCKMFIDMATDAFARSLKLNPEFTKAEKNHKLATNDRQGIHFLLKALLD